MERSPDGYEFDDLFSGFKSELFNFIRRHLHGTYEDAEEIFADTQIVVVLRLSKEKIEKLRSFAFGVAKILILNFNTRIRKKDIPDDLKIPIEGNEVVSGHTYSPENCILFSFDFDNCLDKLKKRDRECLIKHKLEGYKLEEIAEMMRISFQNVHYHVEKAKKFMADCLGFKLVSQARES